VKWLVSSRNRQDIEGRLGIKASPVALSLELNAESVSRAVKVYIDHKVSQLAQMKGFEPQFQDQVRVQLRQRANETFLWVALVCKELEDVESWDVGQVLDELPSNLTQLYARMIEQIQQLKGKSKEFCTQVLSISTLAYRPLHLLEIAALAELPQGTISERQNLTRIIQKCSSFLTIRDDTIYFIHQSAKD